MKIFRNPEVKAVSVGHSIVFGLVALVCIVLRQPRCLLAGAVVAAGFTASAAGAAVAEGALAGLLLAP